MSTCDHGSCCETQPGGENEAPGFWPLEGFVFMEPVKRCECGLQEEECLGNSVAICADNSR